MDYLSHGFWSYIIFNWIQRPIYAVLFGLLPDTSSWFVYAIYKLIIDGKLGRPILSEIPNWVFILYGISHSLIVASIVILIVSLIAKHLPIYMLAWPIAITIDFLTHTKDFLPTPFLWPISDYAFPGISWATPWFMITNYTLIIILMAIILLRKHIKKKQDSNNGFVKVFSAKKKSCNS